MRILHVVPTYLPAVRYGGPIYSVHGLCKALAALGHDVHVFTTNVDGGSNSEVPLGAPVDMDGVKVWYFPSHRLRRLYYSPSMAHQLGKVISDFDLLHLHSVFLWPTMMAARLAEKSAVPYILSPRGMLFKDLIQRKSRWLKRAWIQLVEKRNIANAALLHVTSDMEGEALQEFGFKLPGVVNIPNGVEAPQAIDAASVSSDVAKVIARDGYVLFLGRINWKKGLDRLLKAWQGREELLVIAGNDEEDYLQALQSIVATKQIKNVIFIPRTVSGSDREALYQNARLFVLPSYSENFGNTVLEAMVRAVPVLVTEEVGAADVVRAAGAGLVVSGEELGDALTRLLSDDAALEAMGEDGQKHVSAFYGWSEIAQKMIQAYQSVVGLHSAAHR